MDKTEYIDRGKYEEILKRYLNAEHVQRKTGISAGMRMAIDTCIELLRNEQPADVVEVVRCKDCIWYTRKAGCPLSYGKFEDVNGKFPHENDFCSYGERIK